MALEVKVVRFNLNDKQEMETGEKALAELLNDRWSILLHGATEAFVYVVLQKGEPEKKRPLSMM